MTIYLLEFVDVVLVILPVDALRIVLGQEGFPLGASFLDQETYHLPHGGFLLIVAFYAVGDQRVGDDALQSVAFIVALALVQEAVQVVSEETIVGQYGIDVDVVVLGGVVLRGEDGGEEQRNCDDEFHFALVKTLEYCVLSWCAVIYIYITRSVIIDGRICFEKPLGKW